MEAMVDAGEDWMEPMLDFRNWLASTQDPAKKAEIRETQRRTGQVQLKVLESGERKVIWGPYKLDFRRTILRRLLETQNKVRESGPTNAGPLITEDELRRIRQIWLAEGDWEDSVPAIHFEVTGQQLEWDLDDWCGMGAVEKVVLEQVAAEQVLNPRMLMELFEAEREQHGMSRRTGIFDKIDTILRKEWRPVEEVLAETKRVEAEEDVEEERTC